MPLYAVCFYIHMYICICIIYIMHIKYISITYYIYIIFICMSEYKHKQKYVYVCICIHVYMYTFTYIPTYIYVLSQIQIRPMTPVSFWKMFIYKIKYILIYFCWQFVKISSNTTLYFDNSTPNLLPSTFRHGVLRRLIPLNLSFSLPSGRRKNSALVITTQNIWVQLYQFSYQALDSSISG